jgi:hypothetical protein
MAFKAQLLVRSVITLSVFSGVETSAVVIRSAPSLSGLSPVLGLPETAYKTLTVTVTKNPDDDGALRITTVADVSTPENTDKATLKDSDINTISIISGFKGRGFES